MFIDDKGKEKRGIKVNVLLLQGHEVDCKGKNSSLSKYSLRVCSHTPAAKRVKCFSPRSAFIQDRDESEWKHMRGEDRKTNRPEKKEKDVGKGELNRSEKEREKQGMRKEKVKGNGRAR